MKIFFCAVAILVTFPSASKLTDGKMSNVLVGLLELYELNDPTLDLHYSASLYLQFYALAGLLCSALH